MAAHFNGDPRLKALANSLGVWGLYPFSCHEDELTYINGSNAKGLSDFSPDGIGLYGFHDLAPLHHIKDGGWYGIPYRALIPKGVDHLLAAGRMITSDKTAHMSTRNSASCMLQGQAVGTAAALSVQLDVTPRNLDTDILRDRLRRDGVCLDD